MSMELRHYRLSQDAYWGVASSCATTDMLLPAFDGETMFDAQKFSNNLKMWLGIDSQTPTNSPLHLLFYGPHETPLVTEMGNIRILLPEDVQSASLELDKITRHEIRHRIGQVEGNMTWEGDLQELHRAICGDCLATVDHFRDFFRCAAENGEVVLLFWW